MSAKGCCWDNAVVESFFSTLKHELEIDDNAKTLLSPQQLIRDLAFWIDGYYNRERRHSTIAYLSLIDYEQQFPWSLETCPLNRGKLKANNWVMCFVEWNKYEQRPICLS
jgi:transposase InsO family protein